MLESNLCSRCNAWQDVVADEAVVDGWGSPCYDTCGGPRGRDATEVRILPHLTEGKHEPNDTLV